MRKNKTPKTDSTLTDAVHSKSHEQTGGKLQKILQAGDELQSCMKKISFYFLDGGPCCDESV